MFAGVLVFFGDCAGCVLMVCMSCCVNAGGLPAAGVVATSFVGLG